MKIFAFTLLDERSVAIPPGCAVFVRSGAVAWQARSSDVLMDSNHALLFPETASPAVLTANGSPAALTFLCRPGLDFGAAPCLRLVDSSTFLEQYRLTFSASDADAASRGATIVSALRANVAKPAGYSAHSPSYGRLMQQYVNATLSQPFSLRKVAQTCAVSPFTASRVFHREAGIPLRLYVRRLKLRVALERIAGNRELSQVALDLGFFDHAHFTKAFRAEFGIAPSEWREFVCTARGVAA